MFIRAGSSSSVKILVVEDDTVTRKILEKLLESLGLSAVFAENGAQGLEAFEEYTPELVVSDFSMPEMSGLEMFRRIRHKEPGTKLILMTIYTESDVVIEAINLGVDRFLEKPVTLDKLRRVLAGVLQDIYHAKEVVKYQNLLKAYRTGVDASTIFSILDPFGNFTYVNGNFCAISGYSEDELIGNHYSMIRMGNRMYDMNLMHSAEAGEETIWHGYVTNLSKSAEEYVTEVSLMPIMDAGNVSGYISIEKDMSTLVSSHKAHLRSFFDADKSVMFAYEGGHELAFCNRAFLNFFNFPSASDAEEKFSFFHYLADADTGGKTSGHTPEDVMNYFDGPEEDSIRKIILKRPEDEKEYYFTADFFELDQSYIGLENLNIIRLNDITELELLRKEEISGAMLASIGKLAAGMTHEINTPLTYIKGNIELLEWDIENSCAKGSLEEMKEYFSSIHDGLGRITSIIESMRGVTGEAAFEKEPVNLYGTLVKAARMIYNRAKYITPIYLNGKLFDLNMPVDGEEFITVGSPVMLEQAWIILLNNSLDQLAGNDLTFDEKYIKISVEALNEGRHKVLIADNGGGIEPHILNRLFDLFTSTKKHKGMGIGLNIAKSIIDKHEGTITPFNVDAGASFEIIF